MVGSKESIPHRSQVGDNSLFSPIWKISASDGAINMLNDPISSAMPATPSWSDLLRTAREKLGMSREDLAEATFVSRWTIKAYEAGLRGPSRDTLNAILEGLGLDQAEANAIRHSAGFTADVSLDRDLLDRIEEVPWPQCWLNAETTLANNATLRKLVEYDKWKDMPGFSLRNQVVGVADLAFDGLICRHIANWEEIMARVICQWKGMTRTSPTSTPAWMKFIVDRLTRHDRVKLWKFLDLWEKTPSQPPKKRDSYPVVWEDAQFGQVRLIVLENLVDEWLGVYCKDLIPADSKASQFLEAIRAGAA